jgi:two-component sensor histidine kinase
MTCLLELELPCASTSPGAARDAVRTLMSGACSDDVLVDVLLVVSELVTNAVRHACSACRLTADVTGSMLTIEVHDSGGWPRRSAFDRPDPPRGLGMVQTLSRRWGVDRSPTGKCVWAEFDLVGPARLQDRVNSSTSRVEGAHAG